MITRTQKLAAQAIVNVFETGHPLGDYGCVTLIPGDSGQLTFGRAQTTLASGGLAKLLDAYCGQAGAVWAGPLAHFLDRARQRDPALNTDRHFHNLLRACADDPVMRDTQDQFFEDDYWAFAERIARRDGFREPLSLAVVYDSRIHGNWPGMSRLTRERYGDPSDLGERTWVEHYIGTRLEWLANHSRGDLRRTVYRMNAFFSLIRQDAWALPLPLVIRGQEISLATLTGEPPGCFTGPAPRSRVLSVEDGVLRGLDVRLAQLALSALGVEISADGIYGRGTAGCVRAFQQQRGLPATGQVDAETFLALGVD